MRNEQEQTELLNHLVSRIKSELILGDFNNYNEMVDFLSDKAKTIAYDADNYGYNEAKSIAEDVALKISRLKRIKKEYHIPSRIQMIIDNLKY